MQYLLFKKTGNNDLNKQDIKHMIKYSESRDNLERFVYTSGYLNQEARMTTIRTSEKDKNRNIRSLK